MIKKYSVLGCEVTRDVIWHIHAVGCVDVKRMQRKGWHETIDALDLADEDQVMSVLDPDDLGYGLQDVKIHDCALWKAAKIPGTKPGKNGKAQDAANRKGEKIIQEIIAKIVEARGADSVGEEDLWDEERLPTVDDYAYDLAVEVRKLREGGMAWWRIGHDLYLPGAGGSAREGKSGAAYARRLWERAWGKTYVDGERAPRETQQLKRERAVTAEARPYFAPEAKDEQIIKTVCGKTIHWDIRLFSHSGAIVSPQEAMVHHDPRTIRVVNGRDGRYVEFFETLDAAQLKLDPHMAISKTGPRRAVRVQNIHRVGA